MPQIPGRASQMHFWQSVAARMSLMQVWISWIEFRWPQSAIASEKSRIICWMLFNRILSVATMFHLRWVQLTVDLVLAIKELSDAAAGALHLLYFQNCTPCFFLSHYFGKQWNVFGRGWNIFWQTMKYFLANIEIFVGNQWNIFNKMRKYFLASNEILVGKLWNIVFKTFCSHWVGGSKGGQAGNGK